MAPRVKHARFRLLLRVGVSVTCLMVNMSSLKCTPYPVLNVKFKTRLLGVKTFQQCFITPNFSSILLKWFDQIYHCETI